MTLSPGDITTPGGFVIPAQAHATYLAHQRRRRRQRCKYALSHGETVPFSAKVLVEDGWGPRQITKLTGGK